MFKKVKLKDVDVLTLYQGKMTNGRRSSPIPQLQCRGGSAGCSAFIPDVVQCYNRGSDGLEIQWECKTEMPMEYKFGKVQVSCEGYDYPDDPYILAGSCGLEYTIDRTGVNPSHDSKKSNNGNSGYSTNGWNNGKSYQDEESSNFGLLVFICIVGFIIFKALISPDRNDQVGFQIDLIGQRIGLILNRVLKTFLAETASLQSRFHSSSRDRTTTIFFWIYRRQHQ